MSYDIRGNKVAMTDPDKGSWTYSYNPLGQLVSQTDAKGQTTRMSYDALGRMLTRIDDATGRLPAGLKLGLRHRDDGRGQARERIRLWL